MLITVFGALLVWSAIAYRMKPDSLGADWTTLNWVTEDNPARYGPIRLFNEQMAGEGRKLRVQLDPTNVGLEKVIVQCKAGVGPDIFCIYGRFQMLDYARTSILLPLNEYADEWGIGFDKTWPEVRDEIAVKEFNPETGLYEYVQYSFPANVNANVVFFNKRMFDEIGEPYPSGDWTWDECLDVARKLTVTDAHGRITRYGLSTYEAMETTELIWQFGGRLYDPTNSFCVMDSPEVLEAIEFLHRMLVTDKVMPTKAQRDSIGTSGGWGGRVLDLFAHERVAMFRLGRWALVTLRQFYDQGPRLRGQIGAVHLPYKREKVGIVRAMSVGINKNSPHREEALRFLQFLTSDAFSREVVASADALPPSVEIAEDIYDPAWPEEDFNHLFVEAMKRGRNQNFSPFIQATRMDEHFLMYLALMGEGRIGPAQLCRQLTDRVNREIRANLMRYQSMRDEFKRLTGLDFDPDNFPPKELPR